MMKTIQMYRHARKPLEMNTKPGDKILILADNETDPAIGEVLMASAYQMGLEPTLAIFPTREYEQANPPPPVIAAINASDLTLLCTTKAIAHSPVCSKAMETGHRLIAMEGVTQEILTRGGCEEDYPKMQELGAKIRKIFTDGKRIRVTSGLGSDITASIEGRPGYFVAGKVERQPGVYLYIAAFPDGEVGIAPLEGTAEGIAVIDQSMHFFGKVKSPLTIKVSKGKAIGLEGEHAEALREILNKFGDEYSYVFPAEIAIGINSKMPVTGSMRTDKKAYGTSHLAFGMNVDIGGLTPGKIHLDAVIRTPDVYVDDRIIVSKGRLVNIE